jgi:hypothetical protein
MDMLCLKRFGFEEDIVFGLENSNLADIGVLKFPPQHPVSGEMLSLARDPNRLIGNGRAKLKIKKWIRRYLLFGSTVTQRWGEAGGSKAFTLVLKKHGLFGLGKPFTCFDPVGPENWRCFFDTTFENDCTFYRATYAVHLWNGLLRRNGVAKDTDFPSDNFIEQQKAMLEIE